MKPKTFFLIAIVLSLVWMTASYAAKPKGKAGGGSTIQFNASDFDPLEGKVYRNNLGRTGVFKATGAPSLAKVKWQFKTGGPVRSSPVIVDGTLYIGSGDAHVYAINAGTGKELWKYKTGGFVSGSAAVVGGVVYIASEDGNLYALDAKTGQEKWKAATGGNPAGSPAVAYGHVFLCNGSKGGHAAFSMSPGKLLAFQVADGAKIWENATGVNTSSSVTTDGKYLYAPTGQAGCDVGFHDLASGAILLNSGTGHQARTYFSHVFANGCWYAPVTIRGTIRCYKEKKILWETATNPINLEKEMNYGGEFGYSIVGDIAVTDKLVLTGCDDGNLFAFSADKGEKKWTYKTDGAVQGSPSVAGDVVYFGSWDKHIYAVSLDGKLKGKMKLGDMVNSSSWPGDGVVFVGCDDGNVYAIE